jgi:transcription elongation factor Elf1
MANLLHPITCPVCGAEAEDITVATFDGKTIRCGFCGDYDVSGTVFTTGLLDTLDRNQRSDILERAKRSAPPGKRAMITSDLI